MAAQAVIKWIAAHPYQTAFHVVNGVVICTPAAATVPFLNALGFGATGPAAGTYLLATTGKAAVSHTFAGSTAAAVMSFFANVPAGGIFATAQSAAMGGYGVGLVEGVFQAGAMLASSAVWLRSRKMW